MQLKLTRTQREGGILSKNVIFCLDARVQFTAEEQADVQRYKLWGQVIYNSEAQMRAAEGSSLAAANAKAQGVGFGSVDQFLETSVSKLGHGLKAIALGAASIMRLTITINSLAHGQHIECKDLDELIGAENAIMQACQNLRGYLETAAAFNGGAVVYEITENGPVAIAQAEARAQPAMTSMPPLPELASLSPTLAPETALLEYAEPESEMIADNPSYFEQGSWSAYMEGTGSGNPLLDLWARLTPQQKSAYPIIIAVVLVLIIVVIIF